MSASRRNHVQLWPARGSVEWCSPVFFAPRPRARGRPHNVKGGAVLGPTRRRASTVQGHKEARLPAGAVDGEAARVRARAGLPNSGGDPDAAVANDDGRALRTKLSRKEVSRLSRIPDLTSGRTKEWMMLSLRYEEGLFYRSISEYPETTSP